MVDGYLDVIPPVAQRERVPDALEREAPSLSKTPWFSQHLSCLVVSASSVTSTGLSASTHRRSDVDFLVEADAPLGRQPSQSAKHSNLRKE